MASRDFEVAFRLGAQLTNEFKSTFSSANNAIKSLAGAAAAIGGMVGIGSVVAQVSEMTDSMKKLTAATGVSGQEMKELQDVAKNVFRDNYGESFTDVTDALAKVKQNIQGLNSGELEQVTKDALMLADTFDGDVNEVTRATNNMMKNFGIESTKAMDLFATGAQRGLNFSGEMFDNVSEYAPLFATMGYSADEYFGILQRGAQAGVYNLKFWALMWRRIIETSLIAGKSLVDNQQPRLFMSKVQRLVERRRMQAMAFETGRLSCRV